MQTIVCMKWGTRYPADYANRLWSMIKRNTKRPTQLVCYTDDVTGLDSEIVAYPLPNITLPDRVTWTPWRKISLWAPSLEGLSGNVLFLDLDLVITGSLDEFFDFEPNSTFCVIENWTQMGSGIGNTSVYRFKVGAHPYLLHDLEQRPEEILAKYRNEQTYLSPLITEKTFWPAQWCVSFKHNLMPRWPVNFVKVPPLPSDVKLVAFTGKPDPDDARDGKWPVNAAWKKLYKHVRPTPWIGEHWR
jgi:hypothetical protein